MKCPVCGNNTLSQCGYGWEICDDCYWQYDDLQVENPDSTDGPNALSMNEYKKLYKRLKMLNPEFTCRKDEDMRLILDAGSDQKWEEHFDSYIAIHYPELWRKRNS